MIYLLSIFLFSFQFTWAAPHPATSTSALTTPEKGLYFIPRGFILKTEGTDWVPVPQENESLLDTIYLSSRDGKGEGNLSIRTDKVAQNISMELYTRKWIRDYPNYGFEILSVKNFNINGSPALIVDMVSRLKNKQLRQVVLRNDTRLAILTCLDDQDRFSKALQNCNQIIKSFAWVPNEKKLTPLLK